MPTIQRRYSSRMPALTPWFALLIAAIGNCGFWLFWFNRCNATGLPRKATKITEKVLVLACFAIPISLFALYRTQAHHWLISSSDWLPNDAPGLAWWVHAGSWCAVVLGTVWIESRRTLFPSSNLIAQSSELIRVATKIHSECTGNRTTALLNRIPGNQISMLSVTRKELLLPRSCRHADGFRIGHISDIHFTGQMSRAYYEYVFDTFQNLQPDLIVLTGDIIDYDAYLGWIQPLLSKLAAPHGCSFILGNHDHRLTDWNILVRLLTELGHFDVGQQAQSLTLQNGLTLHLQGNERPWFHRYHPSPLPKACDSSESSNTLRIGLSHSPDQILWARRMKLDLLFCGHTHGGQARFPLIGPLVAPSWYGSRYASGVFLCDQTLMHVSRGVAGTHPFRFWCPPEISLLTLRSP